MFLTNEIFYNMSTIEFINKKFTNVLNELKYRKLIKNDADLAKSLNIAPQNLYKIKSGRGNLTIQILLDLSNNFNINPAFFFAENTPMFMGELKHYDAEGGEVLILQEERMNTYNEKLSDLEEQLKNNKLLINLLKEKIQKDE